MTRTPPCSGTAVLPHGARDGASLFVPPTPRALPRPFPLPPATAGLGGLAGEWALGE